MKFYINLSDYEVLELEGKMIDYELVDDDTIIRYSHIDRGVYSPVKVAIKRYIEKWEVVKKDETKEILECKTWYEDNEFDVRICDKIAKLAMEGKDLSEYGREIDKEFVGLLSTQDIAEKYNINESTVRKAVLEGRLIENIDCKKFGKSWVVKEESAEKLWGNK